MDIILIILIIALIILALSVFPSYGYYNSPIGFVFLALCIIALVVVIGCAIKLLI
jgi:hypothetical protein